MILGPFKKLLGVRQQAAPSERQERSTWDGRKEIVFTEDELDATLAQQRTLTYRNAVLDAIVIYVAWEAGVYVFLKLKQLARATFRGIARFVKHVMQGPRALFSMFGRRQVEHRMES
eukprot:jgi/Ulvmu1/7423/UM036_0084.1